MRLDHESYYASYARLLLSFGLAFRPGQKLLVEIPAEAAALAESLNRFLESLPQEKRVLFGRRYWYLCSVEELAAWSGSRRGTVSAALFRLRQDLREHLEREGFTL